MIKLDYKGVIAAALVGALAVWLAKKAAAGVIKNVGEAVNPVSNENIFYTGIGSAVDSFAGGDSLPLGVRIYDWVHGE